MCVCYLVKNTHEFHRVTYYDTETGILTVPMEFCLSRSQFFRCLFLFVFCLIIDCAHLLPSSSMQDDDPYYQYVHHCFSYDVDCKYQQFTEELNKTIQVNSHAFAHFAIVMWLMPSDHHHCHHYHYYC